MDELLEAQGAEGHTAAIRATCRLWRHALQTAPARLQPLVRAACAPLCAVLHGKHAHAHSIHTLLALQGKPAQMAAFPRAAAVDYGARGAGAALTDADLADACSLLGGRLTRLDIGGAFQLSTAGVQAALRACAALRQLAADGSTLQDDAFSGLAQAPGAGEQSSSSAAALVAAPCGSPRSCAPLQKLESLSLRGCLFLRGTLLADLAAACPHLTSLDLASCGLALK